MDLRKNLTSADPMMDQLRDLNDSSSQTSKGPKLLLEDPLGQPSSLSHQTSSTTTSSLRSPPVFHHFSSEATEYMRLTPVNIKNLTSPLRGPEQRPALISREESSTYTAYKENFNLISRKLEKLLEELDVIYREIGYSNTEISEKDQLIFNHISDSITGFFEQANEEREKITADNTLSRQVLQRILQVLHDPKGTTTIPDLYTRNVIAVSSGSNPNSPKKPTSLITRRRIISKAKNYVIKTYTPKLNIFLERVIRLKTLAAATGDYTPVEQGLDTQELLAVVPPLDTCRYYRSCLSSINHDVEKTCSFIIEHRKVLLNTINFNDVSDNIVERISMIISMFEKEFQSRLQKALVMKREVLDLLQRLNLSPEQNLDEPTREVFKQLPNETIKNSKEKEYLETKQLAVSTSTLERLETILRDYKALETKRRQEKDNLIQKCTQLWEKLKVPQAYIAKFEGCNKDLSNTSVKNYAHEYKRLQDMKKKLIKNLIQDSWTKIQELWSAMHFSLRETAAFQDMFNTMIDASTTLDDDEKVLETCEAEIAALENKLAAYKPLLKLIDEFRSLQNDKWNLERSSRDSSRLLLRNSHRILLEEEKTRKRITRHFPNVIQELIQKLESFEEDSGRPFIVEGSRFLEIVLQQEEEIISKYPRSRIGSNYKNSGSSASVTSRIAPASRSPRKDQTRPKVQAKSHRSTTHRTPMRSYASIGTKPVEHEQSGSKASYNRRVRAARMSSPIRKADNELSVHKATKDSPTKIPTLTRSSTFPNESNFFGTSLKTRTRMAAPEGLKLMSPNRLNSVNKISKAEITSQTPTVVREPSSLSWLGKSESPEKENIAPFSSKTPLRLSSKMLPRLESPDKTVDNSVYTITRSPEGKFLLNVEEDATIENAEGEDTSILADDDNFNIWKRERLARLNSNEGNNNLDFPSSVNWETDVF
ncbi:LAFA_0D15852g1_1 [Lachancea sp. 'fantastica']|nr:LAFA_0D15852g1_1 [Lachancea sp. 'fantastica']